MVNAHRRTLFLTGAPTLSSLNWTEADLSAPVQPCHLVASTCRSIPQPTPDDRIPSWRYLHFRNIHLSTGLTQAGQEDGTPAPTSDPSTETSFYTVSHQSFVSTDENGDETEHSQNSVEDAEELLSQYYEHSFAVHDDIPSSDIISAGSMVEVSFNTEADEYSIGMSTNDKLNSQEQIVRSRLASGYVSNVKDMPNAVYLRSITPQTMTVNLVVGVISISQPRIIRTRKNGRIVELVEMLVGDDTYAGFGINIWLPFTQENRHRIPEVEDLRHSASQLRPQDIVLLRNVALSSFRGKVHGQSLRKGLTTVDLLSRNTIDVEDARGAFRANDVEREALLDPQMLKVKKVKDWVLQFIGTNVRPPALGNGPLGPLRKEPLQPLPTDTP